MLVVRDSFCTGQNLARQPYVLKDVECNVLSNIQINDIDAVNKCAIKEAVKALKTTTRSEWRMCQAFN